MQDTQNIQQPPVQEKKGSSKTFLIILLLFFLCCICTVVIAILVYVFRESIFPENKTCTYNSITYQNRESFQALDGCNTCTCENGSVICTEMACITPYPTEGITPTSTTTARRSKTYTNSTYNYTLEYPTDWKIDSSKANIADESQGEAAVLLISKGNYKFLITKYMFGMGIPICLFDTQDPGDLFEYMDMGPGKSLLTSTGGKWKRNLNWNAPGYIVCEEILDESGESFYRAYTKIGEIHYQTPEDADPQMLVILDQISASIKY